jgi:cellulose synthase operon protein C
VKHRPSSQAPKRVAALPATAATTTTKPSARARAPRAGDSDPPIELQLAIGKDGLGIELGRPAALGCLHVTECVVSLPDVRFPLDVSGGVSRFRHRRGELLRLSFELGSEALRRFVTPRLRGLVSTRVRGENQGESQKVWIAVGKAHATIGIAGSDERGSVLAFDVVAEPHGEDLRLIVARARGSSLPAPATALAISALEAVLGDHARREGAMFVLERAAEQIVRALLPDAGARVPATDGVRWTGLAAAVDGWILHASWGGVPAETTPRATLAREAAVLTRAGDDARQSHDFERARRLDVAALERAPRHPDICGRIAELDAHAGGRAEAALATLVESSTDASHGMLRAELLAEIGDLPAAIAAFARTGDLEIVPALAARAFERAAELTRDPIDALAWLDLAIARAPSVLRLRWQRVARRLAVGRVEDAIADVEHVEALSVGSLTRYAVWWRAGKAWQKAGLVAEAAPLFERALRFVPDEPEALAGLGRALLAQDRAARGVALLARSVEIAERPDAVIDLARALAERLGDRPAAIARVRNVPRGAPEAALASALEGRWRAELGDLAGASLAFAHLRDHAERRDPSAESARDPAATAALTSLLAEGGAFERDVRADLLAAQRLFGAALRLSPNDTAAGDAYRAVGARIVGVEPAKGPSEPPRIDLASADFDSDDAELEARVESLTRRLQGDPSNDTVAGELVDLLLRLERNHELLALLSARLEDAVPAARSRWIPAQRTVLERLEKDARTRGSEVEAQFYADTRAKL